MKIVVLDGYTLNPGDLSWSPLEALGEFIVYDRSTPEEVIERCKDAEAILINKIKIREQEIEALPSLKYIGLLSTGYDVVDINAAFKRGIIVTNVPSYGTESVAQMVFALLLELSNNVCLHNEAVKNGEWSSRNDFCFWKRPLIELHGKTIGFIGFGRIGQATAKIAKSFGMKVIYFVPKKKIIEEAEWVSLDELFKESDIISLHCPLNNDTRGIINASAIEKMKDTALLINTSRGPLINEEDLASALNNDRIAGAGLDVLSIEPPANTNPLFNAKNCIITPHIAWATIEARTRLLNTAIKNLKCFIDGKPENTIT